MFFSAFTEAPSDLADPTPILPTQRGTSKHATVERGDRANASRNGPGMDRNLSSLAVCPGTVFGAEMYVCGLGGMGVCKGKRESLVQFGKISLLYSDLVDTPVHSLV